MKKTKKTTKKTTTAATKKVVQAAAKKARKPRAKKTPAEIKLSQQAFYRKNRKRLLAYANNYYAEHKESVLVKAKERYAKKRKDYFCTECGKKLPREISGHHLYCPKCRIQKDKILRKAAKLKERAKLKAAKKAAQAK